nr:ribonuclease H-like domain-containing protein [Tanacetum cinerariifolium]
MSTQQDIYATDSKNRPPMLNKDNYVPWSSRLLRYAKSRPNIKLIYNSIMNGPYVRRMIPGPDPTAAMNMALVLMDKAFKLNYSNQPTTTREFHLTLEIGTFMPPKPDLVFHTAPIAVKTDHSAFTVSDSEDESETKAPQFLPSFVQSSEQVKTPRHSVQPVETSIPAATPKPASLKGNHKQYASLTHTNPPKHMVPATILTQSKPVSITVARPVSTDVPKIMVTRPRLAHPIVTKSKSPIRWHITPSQSPKTSNSPPRVTAIQAPVVSATQGNMSYLSDFEELNGGYVAFGGNPNGGKISGKGRIKTRKFTWVFFLATKDKTSPTAVETDHSAFTVQLSPTKHEQALSHTNRPTTPIIEDWVSDSEDESETKALQIVPSFVQSSKQVKSPRHSVQHVETSIPAATPNLASPQSASSGKRRNKKACFVCKSMDHLIKDYDYHAKKMGQPIPRNHAHRGYAGKMGMETKMPNTRPSFPYHKCINDPKKGNPQHALKDNGVIDSGCPRHITGNMSYLSNFEELNGGYVAFGGNLKGGMISGKGKIKTCKLDFDDVYFVKELKFNLFSVSQIALPSKVFENDNTCVACKKGKQHRASCKTKPVSSVDQPLYRLHMDLFGHTFVKSLNKKSYCLVVTDDYSRFTWVFLLATKDETSPILKTFITGLENQLSLKVKVIRSDNGTEFKNNDLNQLCGMKGSKREFSVPRTPQQNGIAERKNRTHIEAARTMLADSLLPIPFWAEAVNTACYVQNRVLVTKPHNKTPYELLHGRTLSIGFMRPFGCLAPRAWYETMANYLLENSFQRGKIDQTLFIKKQKGDILLVKQKKDGIFISQDKYVAEILRKLGLTEGKSVITPIDIDKPLLKDPNGEDVDVHTYRSMIGSLMYLTSSRPDIMFVVYACACFQVTTKSLHLHAVKRIFRYLKGKTHLGLWYPKDSPFDLVAYSDSDYAVVATSSIEAEYVAAASCCAQVLWIQNQLLDYRRVGKGFFEVETPLFEGMLVEQQGDEEGYTDENVEEVNAGDAVKGDDSAAHERFLLLLKNNPFHLLHHLLHHHNHLKISFHHPRRVEHLEFDKVAQALEITKLKRRVKKLEKRNKVRVLKLRRLQKVGNSKRVKTSYDTVIDDESNQGRIIAEMDQDDDVVLEDDKEEDREVADAVKDVKEAKVDEIVTAASETVTAASVIITTAEAQVLAATFAAAPTRVAAAPSRRRKGVVIRDLEEESTTSTIIPAETKSKDKAIDHVKRKAKDDPAGMSYDDIRPIFEAKFNSSVVILLKTKEQIEEDENRALQKLNDTPAERAAKWRKLDEEVEELIRHLQIVPNEDDDVYTEATPLAQKVPVVDYQIIEMNNKPYYKIIRADDTQQLYISFLTLLWNFDREDLEALWSLVKERISTTKPKNFSDNFLLVTLR